MGPGNPKKLGFLILLFVLTGILTAGATGNIPLPPSTGLDSAIADIGQWEKTPVKIAGRIIDELMVDDYMNASFSDGSRVVNLYIGQYYSNAKIGAAHSPLVCFPGQGWVLNDIQKVKLKIGHGGNLSIHVSTMIAERGGSSLFAIYWYQTNDTAVPDSLRQKIHAFVQKIQGEKSRNSYVVVSTQLVNGDHESARQNALDFLEKFYPRYLEFITST